MRCLRVSTRYLELAEPAQLAADANHASACLHRSGPAATRGPAADRRQSVRVRPRARSALIGQSNHQYQRTLAVRQHPDDRRHARDDSLPARPRLDAARVDLACARAAAQRTAAARSRARSARRLGTLATDAAASTGRSGRGRGEPVRDDRIVSDGARAQRRRRAQHAHALSAVASPSAMGSRRRARGSAGVRGGRSICASAIAPSADRPDDGRRLGAGACCRASIASSCSFCTILLHADDATASTRSTARRSSCPALVSARQGARSARCSCPRTDPAA